MEDVTRVLEAMRMIGLVAAGEVPSREDLEFGLRILNGLNGLPLTNWLATKLSESYRLPSPSRL